jgi:Strictosidine synthase
MTESAGVPSRSYRLNDFVEGVWSPEDLVGLPGTSWIVVSGMRSARRPGRLFVVDAQHRTRANELRWEIGAEQARMGPDVFDPHGIAARRLDDRSFELLVVDHGGGEAIDRLRIELHGATPVIVGGDRIVQPPQTSANAVAHLPDGSFIMTSMFDPHDHETLSKFARGENTGRVWRWSPSKGWSRFGPLQLSGANGVAVSPDGSLVIVCEWAARRVWLLAGDGTPLENATTDFLPDNLRWTKDGRLLLAGQIGRPEAVLGCEARGKGCPLAFKTVLLDPVGLQIETLIMVGESEALEAGFGGATGALEVGESIWVGSFNGERIGILSR